MRWHGGKGSTRRPAQVPKEKFDENWEKIFGKKDNRKDRKKVRTSVHL